MKGCTRTHTQANIALSLCTGKHSASSGFIWPIWINKYDTQFIGQELESV